MKAQQNPRNRKDRESRRGRLRENSDAGFKRGDRESRHGRLWEHNDAGIKRIAPLNQWLYQYYSIRNEE